MHVAVIAPSDFYTAEQMKGRPVQMALAHAVLERPEYARFMRDARLNGKYVIMDNSLMENGHQALGIEQVVEAAHLCAPAEVVLPDVWRDARNTIRQSTNAIAIFREYWHRDINLAAVVQGQSPMDLIYCYGEFANHPDIDVIHIPKVVETIWPYGGRFNFLHYLSVLGLLSDKPHHLLGIWFNPIEIRPCSVIPQVRSVDTALPIHAGLQYRALSVFSGIDGEKPSRIDHYFDHELRNATPMQLDLIWRNVQVLDFIAKG